MIERIISPVVDRLTGDTFFAVNSHEFCLGTDSRRRYSIRRVTHNGIQRTLVTLTPQHDTVVMLSAEALVSPTALTLGSSMRAVTLPYDDETGGLIAAVAGMNLRQHPKFNTERSAADTRDAAATALGQLGLFSPSFTNQSGLIGTPRGW
jgi:hypothetical protein